MTDSGTVSINIPKECLTEIIAPYLQIIDDLKKENARILKNAEKEVTGKLKTEIEHYRERMSLVYGEFDSKKEKSAYDAFYQKHGKCRSTLKINAGRIPYVVEVGTGVGTIRKVVCPICGEEKEITDASVW